MQPSLAPVDMAILRRLQEEMGADEATMRGLFAAFLQQSPRLLADARVALAANDARTLFRAAHTIKSSASILGASELARLCRETESASAHGLPADAAGRLAGIEAEFARVRDALAGWTP